MRVCFAHSPLRGSCQHRRREGEQEERRTVVAQRSAAHARLSASEWPLYESNRLHTHTHAYTYTYTPSSRIYTHHITLHAVRYSHPHTHPSFQTPRERHGLYSVCSTMAPLTRRPQCRDIAPLSPRARDLPIRSLARLLRAAAGLWVGGCLAAKTESGFGWVGGNGEGGTDGERKRGREGME